MAVLVVGCVAFDPGINDGRGGKRSAVSSQEETTASEGDRSKTQTAQEPIGLDAQVVSPPGQQANLPAGFGEGSLWAMGAAYSASASASTSASASASAYSEIPDPSASASAPSEVPEG